MKNRNIEGDDELPIKFVKRNDPRIKASADSIYAYNTTRGNSPSIISNANQEIVFHKKLLKLNEESLKKYPQYKVGVDKNRKDLNEKIQEIQASKPNDQPVKPGAFGSKVIVKKNKKSLNYSTIQDPEIERIKKKNKPIHYLSEERYADNPIKAIVETTHIPHKNTPIAGTQRYKIQKPVTSKIEAYPNLNEAKKIYPNITDKENSEILKKMNTSIDDYKNVYHNPTSYYDPTQKTRWNTTNPNDIFSEYDENSKFKKHGLQIENFEYNYENEKSEIPQFAKPKYKWLPEDEEDKEKKKEKKKEIVPVKEEIVPVKEEIIPTKESTIIKKLPGGNGPAAQYPNMKQGFFDKMKSKFSGLMQNRKVNSKNVNKISVTGPSFVSGAKSVKQYRGDENLPEASNGIKKDCGCKHMKSKYKYQDGSKEVSSTEDYMDYLSLLKDKLSGSNNNKNLYDFIINKYKKQYRNPDKSNRHIIDREEPSEEIEKPEVREELVPKERTQRIKRTGVAATPNKKYKYRFAFKEGANMLTIPEGSAIVTANGGKNKQALAAYKKGNYKLLNKIIDDMPEDNVSKAQEGKKKLKSSSALGYVPAGQHKEKYFGKVKDADFDKLRENNPWYDWSSFDPSKLGDVEKFQKAFNKLSTSLGSDAKLEVDDKLGEQTATAKVDYMGDPGTPPGTIPIPPGKIPDNPDEYEEVGTEDFKTPKSLMSAGEFGALGGVLAQGVQRDPKESYLKLGRYDYASQLDRTLRENSVDVNTAKQTMRDMSSGNAGNYLSNVGNLAGKKFDANAAAVTDDTLKRQDILNKNVDLGNVEATTNRSLKDYYDDIKRQNVNDYNAVSVKAGQSFDESFDTWQKMKNENQNKAQEMQLLREASPNYTMIRDPKTGVMKSAYRYKKVGGTPAGTKPDISSSYDYNSVPGSNFDPGNTSNSSNTGVAKKGLKKAKTYKRK